MKILVVNLLRLGDFIQAVPVVHGLKSKYPRAKVDVLVHTPALSLQPMLPFIDRWWAINRDELQEGLGNGEIPLLTSFDVLREQCEQINSEGYDLVINLTQTYFSAWLMGYLQGKSKLGLTFNSIGRAEFFSPWFRYLDGKISGDVFHHLDIFSQACEVFGDERRWPFVLTPGGESEVRNLGLPRGRELIAVQALTSDEKKNWGEDSWVRWLAEMQGRRPDAHFVFVGAPFEQERLRAIVNRAPVADRVSVAIVSLQGALSLLNKATVLVTGDTSIKHLANAARCRVMEIALGSSDFRRTGIYKANSLIVHGRLPCSPCPHSGGCSQATHKCAEQLTPALVADATVMFLREDWNALAAFSRSAEFGLRRSRVVAMGFWYAQDLSSRLREETMLDWIDRSAWKFLLNAEEKGQISSVGTEVYRLRTEIGDELAPFGGVEPLLARLEFLEKELLGRRESFIDHQKNFERSKEENKGLKTFDLAALRSAQNKLQFDEREIEIKMKLVQSLKFQLAEKV